MSWKKYGGINHFEQLSNINSTNLVVDHLSLRFPYEGIFSICGELIVSGETYLDNNISILGNIYNEQNTFIAKSLFIEGNLDLSENLNVRGNTYQYNPLYLVGKQGQGNMYFVGSNTGVGMNKMNPDAVFDIYGSRPEILNVFSNQSYTTNILARNNLNYGITLNSNTLSSSLNFYHKDVPIHSIYDSGNGPGQIKYEPTGNMIINVPNNLKILSKFIVSDRIDQLSNSIDTEIATIYDNSDGIFLPDIYNNSKTYSGNALSLISTDNNSTTFLNITTPDQIGWKWGGGVFPEDSMRNMGTMGYLDETNKYVPSETFVSGNSLVNTRSTIGINTYSPKTERYIMDMNGALCIQHQEIHLIQSVNFEIISVSFAALYGIAIGKSNTVDNKFNYLYFYLLTQDGGETWTEKQLFYKNTISNVVFKAYYYNPTNIIISSDYGYLFYSNNGGIDWNFISNSFPSTPPSIYITNIFDDTNANVIYRTFLAYPKDISNKIPSSIYYFDNYSTNTKNLITPYDITCMSGYNNYLFAAGIHYIVTYDVRSQIDILYEISNTYVYNAIYTLDGIYTIAVGNDIISYTKNSGRQWTNISNLFVTFNDIFILDTFHAIAVGKYGIIYYTTDGYTTWNELTVNQINGMGNGSTILNAYNNITTVNMTSRNTFILSCVSQSYEPEKKQPGKTNMFYLFFSDLFNRAQYEPILDIYGNMVISGDININDNGNLQTNSNTFYFINQNANNVYFAGDASNIIIGNAIVGGTTYLRHQFDVSDNTHLHKNLLVNGIQTITNTEETMDYNSGALQIAGGISVQKSARIGGNLLVNGTMNIKGGIDISGNIFLGYVPTRDVLTVNAKSFFNNDISLSNNLYVMGDTSLNNNLYIRKNTNIGNDLFVARNIDISNNVTIEKDIYIKNDAIITNTLVVNNDVSFNRNFSVGNDISVNRYLSVENNAFFNNDVYVTKNQWIYGNATISIDLSLNGNQIIGNNLSVNGNTNLIGNVSIYGNTYIGSENNSTEIIKINSLSIFNADVSMNQNINIFGNTLIHQNATILQNQDIGGNQIISGNQKVLGNQTIGINNENLLEVNSTSTFTNLVTVPSLNADTINCPYIYSNSFSSKEANGTITFGSNASSIIIGGPQTSITLANNSATFTPSFKNSIYVLLNTKEDGNNSDVLGNGGVFIQKGDDANAAFFAISKDEKQVKFKTPTSNTVVSINIHDLSSNLASNNNGLLVLQKYSLNALDAGESSSISHQINVSSFDISNILQRSMYESNLSKQVIITDVSIKGNLIINKSITTTTSALDVSGDFAHFNGWIRQF